MNSATTPSPDINNADAAQSFLSHRRHLFGVAYRMLGTVSDTEDILQDAFLRWQAANRAEIQTARGFLTTVVTRLCLDFLKSARHQREIYPGQWLPEPLPDQYAPPVTDHELAQDLSMAMMMTLERLSPLERAVYLLHDVFDADYPEISKTLNRSEASCRQLAVRARGHIKQSKPRFPSTHGKGQQLAAAFLAAARQGNMKAIEDLLAEDVIIYTDGGGKRIAALNPIYGAAKSIRFLGGIQRKGAFSAHVMSYPQTLNNSPAFLLIDPDGQYQTATLEISEGHITRIYLMRNPDKLHHMNPGKPY